MQKGYNRTVCKSLSRCHYCKAAHHTSMCFKNTSHKSPNKTSVNASTVKSNEKQDKPEMKSQSEKPKKEKKKAPSETTSSNQVTMSSSSGEELNWKLSSSSDHYYDYRGRRDA